MDLLRKVEIDDVERRKRFYCFTQVVEAFITDRAARKREIEPCILIEITPERRG